MRMILSVMAAGCAMALFAVTESEINAAIEKGSAFLLSRQKDDGHFSDPNTPALTALPVWALSGTKEARGAAVKKAVAYVLAAQNEDGGFYVRRNKTGGRRTGEAANGSGGPGGLSTYNTAVCLSALFESRIVAAEPLLKARRFLAESQLQGDDSMAGGFGYGKVHRRRHADLSNTSYALDAMRRTESLEEFRTDGKKVDVNWEKAIAYVTGLQQQSGGAAYTEDSVQAGTTTNASGKVSLMAYGSMSYAAVLSMSHAKLTRSDPRVRNALEYCRKYWSVEENPGMGNQGLFYYYDIMSRALSVSGVDDLGGHEWKKELAAKLIAMQKEDGSWSNENNRFWEGDEVLCTSFALIGLQACK